MRSPRRFFRPPAGPALAATLVAIAVLAGCAPTSVGADREAGPPSSGAYDIVPEPGRTTAATPPSARGAPSLDGDRIAFGGPQDTTPARASPAGTSGSSGRQRTYWGAARTQTPDEDPTGRQAGRK